MDNRESLLDCALELFSLHGYDAVGVSAIVDLAAVTKPTLYHYFGSKRGLLDALLQRGFQPLFVELEQSADYQGDLVLTLEKMTSVLFRFAQGAQKFYRMQLGMYLSPLGSVDNQSIRPYARRQQEIIQDVFSRAAHDHGSLRDRQARYTAGFLGLINAIIGLYLNDEWILTDELVYQTVHQFMHGIFS